MKIIPASTMTEGAGVRIARTIGTPALNRLDPFLMLDHFDNTNPDDYLAGFPEHPHRGFITLTYMLDGKMEHRDSMGNKGVLEPGGAQWMKAGSGVIHSEMPRQIDGLMRGFQLWINLPADQKMSNPQYAEYQALAFPVVDREGSVVRVITGDYEGVQSPIQDANTRVQYLDVSLHEGTEWVPSWDLGDTRFLFLFEGDLLIDGQSVEGKSLVTDLSAAPIVCSRAGARFLAVSGAPIGEPIVARGPFVMNTSEQIHQAIDDYQRGRLVR